MLELGITGTRDGGTPEQLKSLAAILRLFQRIHFRRRLHCGCCVGVDEQAAELAKAAGFILRGHLPKNRKLVSTKAEKLCDYLEVVGDYRDRNESIVYHSKVLLVVPKTDTETVGSGTWMTYRFAKTLNKATDQLSIIIIWPNGQIEIH